MSGIGIGEAAGPSGARLSDAEVFRRAAVLFRPYWGRLAGICGTTVLSTALAVVPGVILADVVNLAIDGRRLGLLFELCGLLLVLPVISGLGGVAQVYWASVTGQAVVRDLRGRLHRWLSEQPLEFFLRTPNGEIQSRITNDIAAVEDVLVTALRNAVVCITVTVSVIVSMLILNPVLAVCTCITIPVFLMLAQKAGRTRRDLSTAIQDRTARLASVVAESLSIGGIVLSRVFGGQHYMAERFTSENEAIAEIGVQNQMLGRWLYLISSLVFAWIPAITYGIAGWAIIDQRKFGISLGVIVAFAALQARLFAPGGALTQLMGLQIAVRGSAGVLRRLLEWCEADESRVPTSSQAVSGFTVEPPRPAVSASEPYPRVAGDAGAALAFDHVCYSRGYDGRRGFSLKDITFTVEKGQMAFVVGPSGSGKSTMAYLAAGLLQPDEGTIGVGRSHINPGDPGCVGLASQDSHMLNASIAENLRISCPRASDSAIEKVIHLVGLGPRISSLPGEFNTIIGERGSALSNGERQRLSIARLLLQQPSVAILDEATNALDSDSQIAIGKVIEEELHHSVRLVIAHQIWTVAGAEHIIVLRDGRIAEQGSHAELLTEKGEYWRYARQQLAF